MPRPSQPQLPQAGRHKTPPPHTHTGELHSVHKVRSSAPRGDRRAGSRSRPRATRLQTRGGRGAAVYAPPPPSRGVGGGSGSAGGRGGAGLGLPRACSAVLPLGKEARARRGAPHLCAGKAAGSDAAARAASPGPEGRGAVTSPRRAALRPREPTPLGRAARAPLSPGPCSVWLDPAVPPGRGSGAGTFSILQFAFLRHIHREVDSQLTCVLALK